MPTRVALPMFAVVSMAMPGSLPARADSCKWFTANWLSTQSPCGLDVERCRRRLDAAATAHYGRWNWNTKNFVAVPTPCSTGSPINCTAYYCPLLARMPLRRSPATTQAHRPLSSSAPTAK
jgi:hypothetical protein